MNIVATAVRKKKNSAGVVLAAFRFAKNVLKKTNGALAMDPPGSALTVNASA